MLKFNLFYFAFFLCGLPIIASSVVIDVRQCNTAVVVEAFLPISGYSNAFFPTEFVFDEGVYTLSILETKTVGIVLYVKNYSLEIPIYLTPGENLRIILDPGSKDYPVTFLGANSECHYKYFKHSTELTKEYNDLFLNYPTEIDDSLILSIFRKEAKKMRNIFDCRCDSLFAFYQQDLFLDLMGSLHRKYRGNVDLLPLYELIIDEFKIDQGLRGSLSVYSYFYYLSFESTKEKAITPRSSFFTTHEFLFRISNMEDLSYMVQTQFLVVIKMNGFASLDAKCEAFNDIKDIVIKYDVNMAPYFMKYFPDRYLCKN